MNRQELINAIAVSTDSSKVATSRFLDAFIDLVQRAVVDGDRVKIAGFGSFEKTEIKQRPGRNPRTGESILIEATSRPKFTPGEPFKDLFKS